MDSYLFKGLKVNEIAWLKIELANFDAAGRHLSYYATGTSPEHHIGLI